MIFTLSNDISKRANAYNTMPEIARILSEASGKRIEFEQIPLEEVRKFNEDFATMFEWFYRVGFNADIPKLVEEFGISLTSFPSWAAEVKWS